MKGPAQAVKPDVCRCAAFKRKHSLIFFFSITFAEEAQHLQLELWFPTWKGRSYRETDCGRVAYLYSARCFWFWVCRTRFLRERCHVTHLRAVRFSSTRTPSTLTSASSRSTYRSFSYDLSKHWFSCKWFQWRRPGVVAALTISVLSKKCFLIVLCLRFRAPHHCGDPDPSRTGGQTSVVFLTPLALNVFGKWTHMVPFSILRQTLGLRPSDQSCHHETWLLCISSIGITKWNHQAHYNGNIRLKERPASSGYGAQKRNISEVLSDHSLSSWMSAQPFALPGSCDLPCSSSRSDLMRFDVSYLLCFLHLMCLRCVLLITILMCTLSKKNMSDVESIQQRSLFGRTDILPWSCLLGLHTKTMWNKKRYCGQSQSHVWIQNFRGGTEKLTYSENFSYFFMVLWHGRSCKEVCGTISCVGEQNDSTTLQSINSMHWRPPLQRRRNKTFWKIVTRMLSNCSEMLRLGKNWTTWHSMVSK